eukprot:gnl/MRDRNA2_/MRDRNA2_115001_c0_seq1.p1 gnl/MRDRNA2_/MRDRNA2_115001_c0~~gnl/MRDRNA2_/MRDRNA2_115001_c0_seq1.p1  ORF type:complete len:168 (+),score=53.48 gnl/MRDRNA2_/MRDRNA2_115001_c0_seq1:1-504(+)
MNSITDPGPGDTGTVTAKFSEGVGDFQLTRAQAGKLAQSAQNMSDVVVKEVGPTRGAVQVEQKAYINQLTGLAGKLQEVEDGQKDLARQLSEYDVGIATKIKDSWTDVGAKVNEKLTSAGTDVQPGHNGGQLDPNALGSGGSEIEEEMDEEMDHALEAEEQQSGNGQ